jgi:aryl-alcohol dehydrogenase-like predicted oxidoreductase
VNYRALGNSGIQISEIGFGCGNTAGLMVQGTPEEQRSAVQQAIDRGINYFDTAPNYGERIGGTGVSERNLGQALRALGERPLVGTKVEFVPDSTSDIAGHTRRSVEASLERLGVKRVDIVYLHNRVAEQRLLRPGAMGSKLSVSDVLGSNGVAETLERLRDEGKVGLLGFCSSGGAPAAVREVISSGRFQCMQLTYNMLNPTEASAAPAEFDDEDYGQTLTDAAGHGMGAVVIRVLAGGGLSAAPERHPLAEGSRGQAEYDSGLEKVRPFRFLAENGQQNMAQAAIRFALSQPSISTVLVGFSGVEQIDEAAAASAMGELEPGDLQRIDQICGRQRAN